MKYIDIDKLKALIKQQIRWENLNFAALGGGGQTFCINTLEWVLKQIDSLQHKQPEDSKGKFMFPKFLYARTKDNKTIDVSYVPQSMDAIEYVRNDYVEEQMDTGWISVKDRLPEVGHFVLTCVSDTGTPQCVGMALLLEDRTWWDGDMKVCVDYWMEVPKFNNEKK